MLLKVKAAPYHCEPRQGLQNKYELHDLTRRNMRRGLAEINGGQERHHRSGQVHTVKSDCVSFVLSIDNELHTC